MTIRDLYEEAAQRGKEDCEILIYDYEGGLVIASEADWDPDCGFSDEVMLT